MRSILRQAPAVLLIAVALAPAPTRAASNETGIEIIDFGVYTLSVTRRVAAPHDVSRERNIVADVKVVRQVREIAAQPGRSFGYQFRLTDPALAGRPIVLRTIFPRLTNPETGRSATRQERIITAQLGAPIYDGYRFDYNWEMAEGIWRFQIVIGGKVVSEQRFKIVVPLN